MEPTAAQLQTRVEELEHQLAKAHGAQAKLSDTMMKRDAELHTLEQLFARRQAKSVQMYDLGIQVRLPTGDVGRITGVFIDRGGVKYYVVWWKDGYRHEERCDGTELELYSGEPLEVRTDG